MDKQLKQILGRPGRRYKGGKKPVRVWASPATLVAWLKGDVTMAEVAGIYGLPGRGSAGYVRIAIGLRHWFQNGKLHVKVK